VPYDFRHTFASRAANEENALLGILVGIMGHANLRSIMKYVHTFQHQMDREMVRLDKRPPSGAQKAPVRDQTTSIQRAATFHFLPARYDLPVFACANIFLS